MVSPDRNHSPDLEQVPYIGRFAPSPTGPLHFGSLVAALASYLDARHHKGRWLLRMEDLDPPREQPGAKDAILTSLEAHHLFWDGPVLYQSQRLDAYANALATLDKNNRLYPCYCTRKSLALVDGPYPGTCRKRKVIPDKAHALRLLTEDTLEADSAPHHQLTTFDDLFLGRHSCNQALGDVILRRKDGLFAYQLAVVVDDIYQEVSHVIRGVDLIDCTPSQIFLFHCLNKAAPHFGHIAMALNHQGQKLSKQHGALPLNDDNNKNNLRAALKFLNHTPPADLTQADNSTLLEWASAHWRREALPTQNARAP